MRQYPRYTGLRSLVALGWVLEQAWTSDRRRPVDVLQSIPNFRPFPTGVLLQQLKQRRSYSGEVLDEASVVTYGSEERPKFG